MSYCVIKKQEIDAVRSSVAEEEKKAIVLLGGKEDSYAVYAVVVNNVLGKAEVHDRARGVWYALSGSAVFVLGGAIKDPQEKHPGEWVAEKVVGGELTKVEAGDIIDIPAGVPHQIDARGGRIEFLIVKING